MRTTPFKLVLFCLAVLLCLSACGEKDKGYIINQSNSEAPTDEITAFYEGKTVTVTEVADNWYCVEAVES